MLDRFNFLKFQNKTKRRRRSL